MNSSQKQLDFESAEARLNDVRTKRGYLLPHHGLLALTAPELLQGYDACYSALTLGNRYLEEKDKEFVWLGILAVKEEFLATQHVAKYLAAGGSMDLVPLSVRMAAYAQGAAAFEFAHAYWRTHVAAFDGRNEYRLGLKALIGSAELNEGLIQMSMLAIQTSIRNWTQLKWHIEWAYDAGVPETHLSEALSYSMFTGSIPNFIEGCEVWRGMIANNEVPASEPFKKWAALDQNGPD